jgi:hypothetical protein
VLGMCLGGAGVGTVCVSQLLDGPPQKRSEVRALHRAAKNAARADDHASRARAVAAVATPAPTAHANPHPAATATPHPDRGRRHRANAKAAVAEDEFGFERITPSGNTSPPATAVAASSGTSSPVSSGSTSAPQGPAPPASDPAAEEFAP